MAATTSAADLHGQWYDYIVVGLGGIGSAALYWLSKRSGKRVLGLEQYTLGHHYGSSEDVTRIIRLQYNDIKYTRLTPDTYRAWSALEDESGMKLVHKTGAVYMGREGTPGGQKIEDMIAATRQAGIPYERWTGKQLRSRYPQFHCEDDVIAIYQKDGGIVDASLGNALHVQMARGRGACVKEKCTVQKLVPLKDNSVQVFTTRGVFRCRRVILTTGAWMNQLLSSLGTHVPMVTVQDQVTYLATPNTKLFTKDKFPAFVYFDGPDYYYSTPIHTTSGFKIALELGGPVMDPATRTMETSAHIETVCIDFLKKLVPQAVGPVMCTNPCMNLLTYDWDFVVDTLATRGHPQVVLCNGAGHAFKFAALLGKILTELAVDGRTGYDIKAFTMDRPGVMDPNYKPCYHAAKKIFNPLPCKPSKL